MSANTILTSIVTGGTNNHATVAEEANATVTDFVTQGVVGAITLNTGSGGTGSFCVNADASPDMGVTVKAGQAYISATPSSQGAQVLRARAAADYTTYVINSNSSGSTKYDWLYLSVSAVNANNPDASADNVTSIFTSRSSSNTTDNGTPPTYGLLLAIITVANAASSITNGNITDKRFNASIGAQNGSLIVTQAGTGSNAKIQAAGQDANVNLELDTKGTGTIVATNAQLTTFGGAWTSFTPTWTNLTPGNATNIGRYIQVGKKVTIITQIVFGSTSSMGSNPTLTLPVTALGTGLTSGVSAIGQTSILDSGVAQYTGSVLYNSTTSVLMLVSQASGSYVVPATITSSVPGTWNTNDVLTSIFEYEAA